LTVSLRISDHHRKIHRETLQLARRFRHQGDKHARLMALAATSRYYFSTLRALGE